MEDGEERYVKISADGRTEIRGLTLEMAMALVHQEYIYLEEKYRNEIRRCWMAEEEKLGDKRGKQE